MFLIYCEEDHSHCKVEDFEVKYDDDNIPKPGEVVSFFWQSKEFQGSVVMHSSKYQNTYARRRD